MWSTDTHWFDVAIVMAIFAVGTVLFGRFEEHRPRWRRLLKQAIVLAAVLALSAFGYRWIAWLSIGLIGVAAAIVHGWWLPKNGVNGWTCEPRSRYYELIKVPPDQRPGASH